MQPHSSASSDSTQVTHNMSQPKGDEQQPIQPQESLNDREDVVRRWDGYGPEGNGARDAVSPIRTDVCFLGEKFGGGWEGWDRERVSSLTQ